MIKKSILFLVLMLIVIMGFLFLNYEKSIEKDILYLKNGTTIISEETWEGGHLIYYREGSVSLFLEKEKVAFIAYGDIQETLTGQKMLFRYISEGQGKIFKMADNSGRQIEETKSRLAVFWNKVSSWMLFIIVLPVSLIIIRSLKRKPWRIKKEPPLKQDTPASEAMPPQRDQDMQDLSDTLRIVHFFLALFRLQIKASGDADSEWVPIGKPALNSTQVYQLRIKHDGEWISRRMSIGPLGEESGSKSDCFYVIYDVHMVIKIPSTPVNDFYTYIENIKREGRIVDKLAPKECIIPKISVILQRVYEYPGADNLTPEKLEEKYIRLLGNRKDLQEYLKIGDTFVFFMDLSKYYFLGHIVKRLHDLSRKMVDEITTNPGLIWDAQAFTGRYGFESGAVCYNIQNLYAACETDIRKELAQTQDPETIQPYQLKGWFLNHLAGRQIAFDKETLNETGVEKLNALFKSRFKHNARIVKKYRGTIRKYIREKNIIQNRPLVESIASNILELLAWLGMKKVAMRDLKPDNLLVAGDPANYPRFLKSAADYSIGLIDVETAVNIDASDKEKIPQPKLGGTPNYATPSHLLNNDALRSVFNDLPHILHIQDWQAALAIIYKVATGDTLFKRTSKLLPEIIKKIQMLSAGAHSPADTVKIVSQMFWQSAQAEFFAKTDAMAPQLNSATIELTENSKRMLKDAAVKMRQDLVEEAEKTISQTKFTTEKNRRQLLEASPEEIGRIRARWERKPNKSQNESVKTAQITTFLTTLERLRQQADDMGQITKICDRPEAKLNLHVLLSFMFAIILNSMYKNEWNVIDSSRKTRPL